MPSAGVEIANRLVQGLNMAERLVLRIGMASRRVDHGTQSILAKAFRGALMPTGTKQATKRERPG
jgi:hypothetical protein